MRNSDYDIPYLAVNWSKDVSRLYTAYNVETEIYNNKWLTYYIVNSD